METSEPGLTIDELAARFELRPRTIHFYIAQGLLPSPGMRGRSVRYGEDHQLRLEVVRHLTRRHVPLAEIKERLRDLTTEELRRLVEEERRQTEALERARGEPSPQGYIAALLEQARSAPSEARATPALRSAPPEAREGSGRVPGRIPPAARSWRSGSEPDASRRRVQAWRRWQIAPGVELHASDEGERRYGTLIKRLLQVADEPEQGQGDGK